MIRNTGGKASVRNKGQECHSGRGKPFAAGTYRQVIEKGAATLGVELLQLMHKRPAALQIGLRER